MPSQPSRKSARRSVLYVPASNTRAMTKAASLECDTIILDLEDAVAPEAKAEARDNARKVLEAQFFGHREVILRVNGFPETGDAPDTMAEDLDATLPAGPDGVLFPKIRTPADARRAETALDRNYAQDGISLWLMIETPRAVLEIAAIAATAQDPGSRLTGLVMGTNDLVKEMQIPPTPSRLALLQALSMSVLAARAYGLDVLDGVFGDIQNLAGFESEALQGKGLGFDGKTLIHPNQIEPTNRIFSPSAAEIAESEMIVAAFEMPENAAKGVITVNGKMIERLHYEIARRILAKR